MDPEAQNTGVEQLIELLSQIQELAGVGVDALNQAAGGGKAPEGAPPEGAPAEGAPPAGDAPPKPPSA